MTASESRGSPSSRWTKLVPSYIWMAGRRRAGVEHGRLAPLADVPGRAQHEALAHQRFPTPGVYAGETTNDVGDQRLALDDAAERRHRRGDVDHRRGHVDASAFAWIRSTAGGGRVGRPSRWRAGSVISLRAVVEHDLVAAGACVSGDLRRAPAVSSNSSRLSAAGRSSRMLLALSGPAAAASPVPGRAERCTGRRRLPASNATTTWLPTSGRISSPWSSSAYGEQSVAQARTSRSPSVPSHGKRTCDPAEPVGVDEVGDDRRVDAEVAGRRAVGGRRAVPSGAPRSRSAARPRSGSAGPGRGRRCGGRG